MRTKTFVRLLALFWSLLTLSPQLSAAPLGTAFTYQGRLNDGNAPAQGIYDLRFTIYDLGSGGALVGGPITNSPVAISNGLFSVMLDFGSGVFTGDARWLEIGVRTNGSPADFTSLTPRQSITAAPFARYAASAGSAASAGMAAHVDAANIAGRLADSQVSTNVALLSTSPTFAGTVTAAAFVGRGALPWQEVTGTSQPASPNVAYLANSATQVVVTLPTAPSVGDIVRVSGLGHGGWRIAQNAGQSILTENIGGIGTVWTAHGSTQMWSCVVASSDGTRLAATVNDSIEGRIYLSADSGASWIASGPTQSWLSVACSADGAKLVAVPWYGQLQTSEDYGATWTPRDVVREWRCVAASADGTKLVAVPNASFILTSTNSGVTWTTVETNGWWNSVALSADGNIIYAAGSGPIYMSFDFGATWYAQGEWNSWTDIACSADGSKVFATGMYIYMSTNYGWGWTARGNNASYRAIACSTDGTRLVTVEGMGRIYTSADGGLTWTERLNGMYNWWTVAASADSTKLVATGNGMPIYTSVPTTTPGDAGYLSGGQGSEVQLQYIGNGQFRILSSEGTVSIQGSTVLTGLNGLQTGLQNLQSGMDSKVSKAGDTMTGPLFNYAGFVGNGGGLTNVSGAALADGSITSSKIAPGAVGSTQLTSNLTVSGTLTVARIEGNGAMPWQVVGDSNKLTSPNSAYLANSSNLVSFDLPSAPVVGDVVRVAGGGTGGWSILPNAGQWISGGAVFDWVPREAPRYWQSVAASADASKLVAVVYGGQIYTSTDSGVSWTPRESNRYWQSVASSASGTKLVAAEAQVGLIYTSSDSGVTWAARAGVQPWRSVASSADGTKLVVVASSGAIYTSTDSGETWTAHSYGSGWKCVASSADGTKLVVVAYGGPIATSTDSGTTWTTRESTRNWKSVASSADGTKLVAAEYGGSIYASTDSGITWTALAFSQNWQSIASSADGTKLVAAVDGGSIYTSIDSGTTWVEQSAGVTTWQTVASSVDGGTLVAVTFGGPIFTGRTVLNGTQGVTVALQYVGNGQWQPLKESQIAVASVEAGSIAHGQVVKQLNGLTDLVNLTAGPNVTITPSGNTLQIAAAAGTNVTSGWGLTGNSNTLAGVNFLGTTDNQPLELVVNHQRALRLQPATHSPNVVGGYSGNSIGAGVIGGSIAGGGSPRILPLITSFPNAVNADFGSVLGGRGNTVNGFAGTVAGGQQNAANGYASFAAGSGANALHEGSFVWSDTSGGAFPSTTNNQFLIRASGGVGIGTNNPQAALDVAGNVKANGNLVVTGDLEVKGAYKGTIGPHWGAPFPRPAYDSGWVAISKDETITLNHNIGGSSDNYVVDMQFKTTAGSVNVRGFGSWWSGIGGGQRGGWWYGLTSTTILITRGDDELNNEYMRIRIWVYN